MIIVSGSRRSGTSMWMQILRAAGLEIIGSAFPSNWAETIRDANPHGFFESTLTRGIFHRTNPNPSTGNYLFPGQTRHHVVKVFAGGVTRSELGFLDRVLVSIRPWQEFTVSLEKLRTISALAEDLEDSRRQRALLPPIVEWWCDMYRLIRDASTRLYPIHFQPYPRLLADPEKELAEIFTWLGVGDAKKAARAIDLSLYRSRVVGVPALSGEIPSNLPDACDALYERVVTRRPLDDSLIRTLNDTHSELVPLLVGTRAREAEPSLVPQTVESSSWS